MSKTKINFLALTNYLATKWQVILITAVLIVVPLFPKFPAFRIPGTYVAVRLEDFLLLAVFLIFSIPIISNIKRVIKNNVSRSILLFLVIGFVSLLSGVYLTQTVDLKIGLLHWLRRIEYMSLFFIGFIYISKFKDQGFFNYLIKILLLVNLFIFLYGLGQRYVNLPVILTQNEEYSKGIALRWVPGAHINSTFAGHYDLASYLVLTLPIFISAFFVLKDKMSKIILGISIFFGYWLLSVAVSRISIVAFILASTISLFLLKKYKEIVMVVALSLVVFGTAPDLQVRYKRIYDVIIQKVSSVVVVYAGEDGNVNEDRSTSIRLNVEWPRAIRAFYKNPLLGTGYSSITLATDNDYLRALGEAGLFGLMSFILIFIYMYKKIKTYVFSDNFKSIFIAGFVGSTIGIMMTAVFIDIFEASKFAIIYWTFAGLVIGGIKKQ
ncbi:MAG: O-antigen ligase family protein [bacterium]|nr:MAG: O-antigen ligase family protein [bacterium]